MEKLLLCNANKRCHFVDDLIRLCRCANESYLLPEQIGSMDGNRYISNFIKSNQFIKRYEYHGLIDREQYQIEISVEF